MNSDIRVATDFPTNEKTTALIARAGPAAAYSLVALWCWAALNRPSGNLSGFTDVQLAVFSGWAEDPRTLFDALTAELVAGKAPFVEGAEMHRALHDWAERQPWCSNANSRHIAAKTAANARWSGATKSKRTKNLMRDAMRAHDAEGNAPSPAPSPSPVPAPKGRETETEGNSGADRPRSAPVGRSADRPGGQGRNGEFVNRVLSPDEYEAVKRKHAKRIAERESREAKEVARRDR